jgi:hypothetical protein
VRCLSYTNQVYIDCFDANGFYEENYKRILLVMSSLTNSKQLDREWVSSQAVGGTWARSIRCSFDTNTDPKRIKELMVGLEYCSLDKVPESIRPKNNSEVFRFADIDVIEIRGREGSARSRLADRLKVSDKKIGIGDVRTGESDSEFVLACRQRLIEQLDSDTLDDLLGLESRIYNELKRAY